MFPPLLQRCGRARGLPTVRVAAVTAAEARGCHPCCGGVAGTSRAPRAGAGPGKSAVPPATVVAGRASDAWPQ
jgi:hypothetical protein